MIDCSRGGVIITKMMDYWFDECLVLSVTLILIGVIILFARHNLSVEGIGRALVLTGIAILFIKLLVIVILIKVDKVDVKDE